MVFKKGVEQIRNSIRMWGILNHLFMRGVSRETWD